MRISDWSSDVCSSDLGERDRAVGDAVRDKDIVTLEQRAAAIDDVGDIAFAILIGGGEDRLAGAKKARANGRTGWPTMARCRTKPWPTPRRRSCATRCRSEEHTSELQSLMRISYAVFCLKKKKKETERTAHS